MFDVNGDKPQWEYVYDHLITMNINDVVTYTELQNLLPDATLATARSAFFRAMKAVQLTHRRTFDCVRLVGYRMVEAPEHLGLAKKHHTKAKRQVAKAIGKASSADRSLLDSETRRRIDTIEINLLQQQGMLRRLESRQLKFEEWQKKTEARTAVNEKDVMGVNDKIDYLFDLLKRHGIDDTQK